MSLSPSLLRLFSDTCYGTEISGQATLELTQGLLHVHSVVEPISSLWAHTDCIFHKVQVDQPPESGEVKQLTRKFHGRTPDNPSGRTACQQFISLLRIYQYRQHDQVQL